MIHAWGITDKGAVRTQNQDGFYLDVPSEHLAVGVVCDGMGGAKAGNIASLIAVETFVDALQGMQPDGDGEAGPAAVLSRAAETANTAVYHRAVTDPDCRGMGTTMVAALVVEQTAYLLNIGDSRAYHINEDGITRLTRDHSVVEDMVARGDITPEEARTHPRKNLITRALGSEERILLRRAEQHRHGPGAALRGHPRRGAVGLLPAPAPHHSVQRRAGQRYGGPLSDRLKGGNELWIST